MGLFGRKKRGGGKGGGAGQHLLQFAKSRQGVEAYLEPQNEVGDLTVALVAADGEWTRRRIPNADLVRKFADQLNISVHDAATDGYPEQMRETSVENIARPS